MAQFGPFHGIHPARLAASENLLDFLAVGHPLSESIPAHLLRNRTKNVRASVRRVINAGSKVLNSDLLRKISTVMQDSEKRRFDSFVSQQLNESTRVFHGFSSGLAQSLERAKDLGAKVFVDFGLAHPDFLNDILSDEYAKLGLPFTRVESEKALEELHLADKVMVPSAFVEDSFLCRDFPRERLVRNPYGVSSEWFGETDRPRRPGEPVRIVFAGGISVRKGIKFLLLACQVLKTRKIPFELRLFGSWEPGLKSRLAEFESLVSVVAPKSAQELRREFACADVFVLPSLAEGMSRAVLEAMASGLVPIVSEHSGFKGLVTDARDGFITPVQDHLALADRIEAVYEDTDFQELLSRNAQNLAAEFSWVGYWERLKEHYGISS